MEIESECIDIVENERFSFFSNWSLIIENTNNIPQRFIIRINKFYFIVFTIASSPSSHLYFWPSIGTCIYIYGDKKREKKMKMIEREKYRISSLVQSTRAIQRWMREKEWTHNSQESIDYCCSSILSSVEIPIHTIGYVFWSSS